MLRREGGHDCIQFSLLYHRYMTMIEQIQTGIDQILLPPHQDLQLTLILKHHSSLIPIKETEDLRRCTYKQIRKHYGEGLLHLLLFQVGQNLGVPFLLYTN